MRLFSQFAAETVMRLHEPAGLPCLPTGASTGFKALLSPNDSERCAPAWCAVEAHCHSIQLGLRLQSELVPPYNSHNFPGSLLCLPVSVCDHEPSAVMMCVSPYGPNQGNALKIQVKHSREQNVSALNRCASHRNVHLRRNLPRKLHKENL